MMARSSIRFRLLGAAIALLCLAGTVQAASEADEPRHAEAVIQQMGEKFFRGVVNVITGVGEIPRQMVLAADDGQGAMCVPVGLFNGIMMTGVRVGVGAVETATFFIPITPEGRAAMPPTYEPLLLPAYVWQRQ